MTLSAYTNQECLLFYTMVSCLGQLIYAYMSENGAHRHTKITPCHELHDSGIIKVCCLHVCGHHTQTHMHNSNLCMTAVRGQLGGPNRLRRLADCESGVAIARSKLMTYRLTAGEVG